MFEKTKINKKEAGVGHLKKLYSAAKGLRMNKIAVES